STVVAYDLFLSTDEPEKRPLKEFLIKFSVLNGQRPLTLDFHTFCSSTGLNYNNGKYVDHPTPEVVKKELGNIAINPSGSTPPLNNVTSIQQLLVLHLHTGTEGTIVPPPPLAAKPKKEKSQTMASTLPKSQGPKASGALSKKSKRPKLPSTLNEGTRKSKPLPESTSTHPKDLGGNKQPLDGDITSTTPNEGTAKTTPRPEGSLGDKDSGRNIPPADMKPRHNPVADPPGIGAKYQVDETQSTRLRYWSLTKNKGKTSSKVEPDTKPLQL
ncbi:hypothetical protein Tco_1168783, partial [Tanacetum coccineum]